MNFSYDALLPLLVNAFYLVIAFFLGASMGSFLNVVAARLPLEKSLIWPPSSCGSCLQPIPWYDNLPLLGYLRLRGRCRQCGATFSIQYFLVELAVGLMFAGLFYVDVIHNFHAWPAQFFFINPVLNIRWPGLAEFGWHAVLLSFLLAASLCDLRTREIPMSITITGMVIGVILSVFVAWPTPWTLAQAGPREAVFAGNPWQIPDLGPKLGIVPWPVWGPLPAWMSPGGNWQTGLCTSLAGAVAGSLLLRGIGFIFSKGFGKEGLGLGDADLMMMAGAFVGWQIILVGFFLSVAPAFLFGAFNLIRHSDRAQPFGPSLSIGVLAALFGWKWIGPHLQPVFFSWMIMVFLLIAGAGLMLFLSIALRILRSD